jgi:hypothetical protein
MQLQDYDPLRRYATLVAILLNTMATITDETLELHDRLIRTFFCKARSKYGREFAADGQALNDKVRPYAKIGSALIASKAAQTDPFPATRPSIRSPCSLIASRSSVNRRRRSSTRSSSAGHRSRKTCRMP